MESSRELIEARAADFLQRRCGGEWTEADRVELTDWLNAATAHRIAFLRTEAAWEEMSRLKALGAGLPRLTVPTPEELSAAHFGSRPDTTVAADAVPVAWKTRAVGLAAGFIVAVGVAVGVYQLRFAGDRYTTPVGGMASVPLADGSQMTLNTGSRVRVRFSEQERHVELAQGEAFFEVVRDRGRPFIVQAANRRIEVIGTKFAVRLDGAAVRVVVTEGAVRVEPDAESDARPVNKRTALLAAGAVARLNAVDISVEKVAAAAAEDALSWRSGYVVFHETSLADAVAEFNRYNARRIVIADPSIAEMKLTGKFRATNSETFITLLERSFNVHAQHSAADIVLSR